MVWLRVYVGLDSGLSRVEFRVLDYVGLICALFEVGLGFISGLIKAGSCCVQ